MPNKNNEQYREYIITTRYRGSKNKVIPLIYQVIKDLKFNTVLDAFGGTGAVSYLFKRLNKIVVFNEHLKFNYIIGRALIENSVTILEEEDIKRILQERDYSTYPHFIEESFKDVYYTDKENRELDMILANIRDLDKNYDGGDAGKIHKPYLRDCAYWALFQACIIKRPFSLFHRKNLYIRLNKVKRSFGNKVTWERPIKGYIRKFASELNGYIISTGLPSYSSLYDISGAPLTPKMFLNEKDKIIERNNSLYIHHTEADQYLRIPKGLFDQINMENFDLVYIDPPYIPRKGENIVYRDVYHFLEGMLNYEKWKDMIDYSSKHLKLKSKYNIWNDRDNVESAFEDLIQKYKNSILLISHREDGVPSPERIMALLSKYKKDVKLIGKLDYQYALSKRKSKEVLILAK